jgi:fatty acid desaturase
MLACALVRVPMSGPFDRWPETIPALLDAQERVRRTARRKLWRTVICITGFWAAVAAGTMLLVDWAMQ